MKSGEQPEEFDARTRPMSPEQVSAYLVHPDGLLRVPVLVLGDLLVRGYTEALYRRALAIAATKGAEP